MDDSWMYQPAAGSGPDGDPQSTLVGTLSDPSANAASLDGTGTSPSELRTASAAARIRRRNRQITSCLECRRRKLKCDKQAPCTNCTRFKRDCLYLAPALDPHSQQKLSDIKEKMGALEKNLERAVVGQSTKTHPGGTRVTQSPGAEPSVYHIHAEYDDDDFGDEELLEPTPLAAIDNVYDDGVDDELMDLGVQMGKMRISERVGGWIRPKLVDELNDTLKDINGNKSRWSTSPLIQDHRDTQPEPLKTQALPKSFIGPGPDYIAPASSFFFPGTNMSTTLIDYLPSKNAADQLMAQYFLAVHYIAKVVHKPSLEAQYAMFWDFVTAGREPPPSMQAIIFAVMFSAAASYGDDDVLAQFGTSKAALVDSLRSGSEMTLSKANLLRTTKLDTMQAFVIYLIPLIRSEVSRAHSALVGCAIRLAECMGLHRDGSHYPMTAVEIHVRRLLWLQLCFLDLRTCEATGPRLQIRKDDYDTRFPLNVDDLDLMEAEPPTEDKPRWTDSTFIRLRAECISLRRTLWFDMVQIDKKKKSLTSVIVKIQKNRNAVEAKFLPLIDESVPLQALAKHVLTLSMQGAFVHALHRYLFSTAQAMPDRLRQILIAAGLTQLETAIELETKPELSPWAWYRGAFNQYHSALLLMVEVYAYPMRKEAAKIWKCLDYIFDIPAHLSPKQKAELVITDLRDRMEIYHQMRKLKVTTQMEERVGSLNKSSIRNPGETPSLVGTMGATAQKADRAVFLPFAPLSYSSPPAAQTDSSAPSESGKGNSNVGLDGDLQMRTLEDIDWASDEWDRYFPIEQNTGDLNIPDFDFSNFTSGYSGEQSVFAPSASGMEVPSAQNLSDVSFTPAFYPAMPGKPGPSAVLHPTTFDQSTFAGDL